MALCFNCNIALRATQASVDLLETSPKIVSTLEQWGDREVLNGDRLCQECLDLVIAELENNPDAPEQQLGHHLLCVSCGISLSQRSGRRSRPLPEGHSERAYIAEIIFPREIPQYARVCNACWQLVHSRALQEAALVHGRAENAAEVGGAAEFDAPVEVDEAAEVGGAAEVQQPANQVHINLQTYSRTPDTANHCFVPQCTNAQRLRV